MELTDLIRKLRDAREGSRYFDGLIAHAIGWTKDVEYFDDPDGVRRRKDVWYTPGTYQKGWVPIYSTDIQAAYDLAQYVAPHHVGGFTWKANTAQAQLGLEGPAAMGRTPALALCIAAMMHLEASSSHPHPS